MTPVTEIPLDDGATLIWDADWKSWKLMRGSAFIRYLNRFEANFVNSALRAQLAKSQQVEPS